MRCVSHPINQPMMMMIIKRYRNMHPVGTCGGGREVPEVEVGGVGVSVVEGPAHLVRDEGRRTGGPTPATLLRRATIGAMISVLVLADELAEEIVDLPATLASSRRGRRRGAPRDLSRDDQLCCRDD